MKFEPGDKAIVIYNNTNMYDIGEVVEIKEVWKAGYLCTNGRIEQYILDDELEPINT